MRSETESPGDSCASVPAITFDAPIRTIAELLGRAHYTFVRDEFRVEVMEWPCGCSACHVERANRCAVQWCAAHAARFAGVDFL